MDFKDKAIEILNTPPMGTLWENAVKILIDEIEKALKEAYEQGKNGL